MGDHAEAIEIDFDPTIISFDTMLNMFWNWHSPTGKTYSRQYMSAIFYNSDDQRYLAEESRKRLEASVGTVRTEIMPLKRFYMAEDYHQKYTLKRMTEIMDEFSAMYPNHNDLVASTAVARANAYASGYGTLEMFDAEAPCYGLSASSLLRLRKVLERFHPVRCSS
jgi:peptide-methionine (S)-S-oxide reductase